MSAAEYVSQKELAGISLQHQTRSLIMTSREEHLTDDGLEDLEKLDHPCRRPDSRPLSWISASSLADDEYGAIQQPEEVHKGPHRLHSRIRNFTRSHCRTFPSEISNSDDQSPLVPPAISPGLDLVDFAHITRFKPSTRIPYEDTRTDHISNNFHNSDRYVRSIIPNSPLPISASRTTNNNNASPTILELKNLKARALARRQQSRLNRDERRPLTLNPGNIAALAALERAQSQHIRWAPSPFKNRERMSNDGDDEYGDLEIQRSRRETCPVRRAQTGIMKPSISRTKIQYQHVVIGCMIMIVLVVVLVLAVEFAN